MKKCFVLILALLMLCTGAMAEDNWLAGILGKDILNGDTASNGQNVALLRFEDAIERSAYFYDQADTLEAIDALREDADNQALLLVLDTPGGSLYDADEIYHALMRYKADTGRPVYAYMAEECCSAGVFVAMAADTIGAGRMTITGNVGAYIESYSEAGLYEKLGLERVYVSTGKNKVIGYPELTTEQQEIYQQLVDESFGYFKQAISQARGLTEEQMAGFLDGRLLSAVQAQQMGLVDEVLYFDEMLDCIEEKHPGTELVDVTPEETYGLDGAFEMPQLFKWLEEGGEDGESAARRSNAFTGL